MTVKEEPSRVFAIGASIGGDGTPRQTGFIRVAIPDRHLVTRSNRLSLSEGPPASHGRPAINALFLASPLAGPACPGQQDPDV